MKLNTRKVPETLPLQVRRETITDGAIDTEARTVTLVFTTGATVRRRRYVGWDTVVPFDETLVVSKAAIDLSRMNAGALVLDSHSTYTTFAQVGVVERAWIEGKEGKATVRFPTVGIDERADRMFGLVADKIIKNVSVGYSIDKIRIVDPEKKGQIEQRIVERWTPHEISFVTVGADAGAQVRAAASSFPIELVTPTLLHHTAIRRRMALTARSIIGR
jgi:hypothetical protein